MIGLFNLRDVENDTLLSLTSHWQLGDAEFTGLFSNSQLPPVLFTHEAHLRLAYLHIQRYGIDEALETIPAQIASFVDRIGARDKFHMTLTIAAVKVIYHFMQRSSANDVKAFLAGCPELTHHFKDLIGRHYSAEALSYANARVQYTEPDLLPLD